MNTTMRKADFTTTDQVASVYEKRAKHYDFSANLYYLMGFREYAYRRRAIEALQLNRGDMVVELGCGTGLNFPLLQERIGPEGKVIGVDLTPDMLEVAARRVQNQGWHNVDLVHSAAADYVIPKGVDGIISTFALTLEPQYDKVVEASAHALKPGRRFVLLDLKIPSGWLGKLAPVLVALVRPFAVSLEVAQRTPWQSVERYFQKTSFRELYFGVAYIAVGTSGTPPDAYRHR